MMETVDAYIPIDRRHALAQGESLPDRSQGAMLFADISGFTLLAYTLAQELGPQRGAEALTGHLNRIYSAVIAEVHRYGGSVISFSGDAITCWFAKATSPVASGRAAIACALQMQQVMTRLEAAVTPQGSTIALTIKVAVAAGTARRFLVGEPGVHQIDVLAGSLLDRVAAIEHQLQPGEVAIDAPLIAQVNHQALIQEWRTHTHDERCAVVTGLTAPVPSIPWPVLPPVHADRARDWLLPPVYQRLQQEPEGFLAELRPSVAVFHQFSGIDYDDETAGDKLDTYIRWVQTTLAHYEGFLIDITMGDKGSYLYIAFGAPIAHEDDATRAVAAAWALQHLPPTCHFITHFQTGISQGQMYAGAYGSPMRRTYGVLGSDVNIAAQLMQSAQPGHILVTERLAQAVDSYAFQALPPLPLKGVAQLLPVFVVQGPHVTTRVIQFSAPGGKPGAVGQEIPAVGATSVAVPAVFRGSSRSYIDVQLRTERPCVTTDRPHRQRSHTPLVGRVTERDTLLTRLQALATGESGVVIIEGEAGIGKSRLAEEARQHAQRLHLTVLAGTGDAIDQSTPYHAWRPLFARLFALDVLHDPPARQREHVRARLTADFPDLLARAALLNAVLPLDFPDTALTAQMSGEVRRSNTHQVLLTLLTTAAAVRPLVIALEDAHWFDSASWALTRLVWREVHPLLLIIVTRPLTAPLPLEYHALRDNDAVTHLRLDTMSPADIDSLICHRLGVHTLPPPVSHLIREKAEGQPFFSEELAYALRDAGLMHIANGDCHLSAEAEDLQALHFPDTVQGVITSRMDRLAPQHVLTLKVASVIGRVFAYRAVQAVYPIATDRAHLRDYLHELERLDITPLATSAPELTYLFKHIITQEVAYNLMSFAQRQQLHRATAEWYERTQPADLSAYYPTLAHHWHQAGVAPKAIEYFEKAGELALHNHANQEAVRFFSAAAHLAEDPSWQRPFRSCDGHAGRGS